MERCRYTCVTAVLFVLSLIQFSVAEERLSTVVEFHIAPQPLAHALNAWAQQSGLQLIWPADGQFARMQSRPLYGKFEPMTALALLLEDSGLRYSVLKEGTVTLGYGIAAGPTVPSVKNARE